MSYSHSAGRSETITRIPTTLSSKLDRNLLAYAAAAGAVGVGVLALAEPSPAEVVFTPTHQTISSGHGLWLDLNGDGTTDFFFKDSGWHFPGPRGETCGPTSTCGPAGYGELMVKGAKPANEVVGVRDRYYRGLARVLPINSKVGSSAAFVSNASEGVIMGTLSVGVDNTNSAGYWHNVQNQFLGLKFSINGETHYGWARFSVKVGAKFQFYGILTGYAYETSPNTPILTGQRSGTDAHSDSAVPGASLGRLAQGADGLAEWRQK